MVSYRTADQTKGGGLLDKQDGTIIAAKWVDDWNYKGKSNDRLVGLIVYVRPDVGDSGDAEVFLKAGDEKKWRVRPDGSDLDAIDPEKDTGFPQNSNVGLFFHSLENCGFPSNKMGVGGARFLVGLSAHFVRVSVAKQKATDPDRESVQITKINKMPWDNVAAAAAGPSPVQGTVGGGNGAAEVSDGELAGVIQQLVVQAGGKISKQDLTQKIFGEAYASPEMLPKRTSAVTKALKDVFLSSIPGVSYQGGVLSIG